MKIIETKRDLKTYIDAAMGSEATPALVGRVTENVAAMEDRPRWGDDFAVFLADIDLWEIAGICGPDEPK